VAHDITHWTDKITTEHAEITEITEITEGLRTHRLKRALR